MTIAQALSHGINFLKNHSIEDPQLETELLLAHALNLSRTKLVIDREKQLSLKEETLFLSYLQRRAQHEPTAYIVGYQPFMGLNFIVNDNVLIPRPETEFLVEHVLKLIPHSPFRIPHSPFAIPHLTLADIGTGSGCIAVAFAKYLPQAKVIGIDNSKAALKIAINNARINRVEKNCCFLLGDLFLPLKKPVDIIVSNPPYIPSAEITTLQPEVREWEPREALDGGEDGLDYIRKLILNSPNYLTAEGKLFLEIGYDQGARIKKLANQTASYSSCEIIKDLAGKDRLFIGSVP